VTCGKYMTLKKQAHSRMINCLKITDVLHDKLLVVTSGEDELIKFWDTSFVKHKTVFSLREGGVQTSIHKSLSV
jgi:WD40 repeat protein